MGLVGGSSSGQYRGFVMFLVLHGGIKKARNFKTPVDLSRLAGVFKQHF